MELQLDAILEDAVRFVEEAGDITLQWFQGASIAEIKTDGSPVTAADRASEQHLRKKLAERFPGFGIIGEEFGEENPGAPRRWLIDPIDGTKSFVCGVPLYGVLLALEIHEQPVLGILHFPAVEETVAAAHGAGCWWNGVRAEVSSVERIEEARIMTTDPLAMTLPPWREGWERLIGVSEGRGLVRSWGDAYGHALVATGRADIMIDPRLARWDISPLIPILSEAGGLVYSRTGDTGAHLEEAISSNPTLARRVRRIFDEGAPAVDAPPVRP